MTNDIICVNLLFLMEWVICVQFCLYLFSYLREEGFLKVLKKQTIWLPNNVADDVIKNLWTIISQDDPQFFIVIGGSILHMQL